MPFPAFARLVSPDRFKTGAELRALPNAVQASEPAAWIQPTSIEEVVSIVKLANEQRVPLVPCGNLTAFEWGGLPQTGAILVNTRLLNKVVAYEPQDMVGTFQAGMTLKELREECAKHGQWLPLDGPDDATLGGMLATDRSGPRRLGYGTLRDQVLGLQLVNGDGTLRKCGGRVVKNVTGYALEKLYIGSHGTLGLITEVTFKLPPKPECAGTWELSGTAEMKAFAVAQDLFKRLPFVAISSTPYAARIVAEGAKLDFARLEREVKDAANKAELTLNELAPNAPFQAPWPEETLGAAAPCVAQLTFSAKMSEFKALVDDLDTLADELKFQAPRIAFQFPSFVRVSLETVADAKPDLSSLVAALRRKGFAASVIWKAPGLELKEPRFGPARAEWALMKKIKDTLDPRRIMNPGRLQDILS
jgi:FAD/FMN-containing dehydrogenase